MDTINKHSELIVEVCKEAEAAIIAAASKGEDEELALDRVLYEKRSILPLAENTELENRIPARAGAMSAQAWLGKYAVVAPLPRGFTELHSATAVMAMKGVIEYFLPNCAEARFTADWAGAAGLFRADAPPELCAGPAMILLSGKGMALWALHETRVLRSRDKKRRTPPPSSDADDDLRTDAQGAFWGLFTDIEEDNLVHGGGCGNAFCTYDGDDEHTGVYELDIRQTPYTTVCEHCYCDAFPSVLEGWDVSLVDEYIHRGGLRPPTPPQEADPAPVAKKVKVDE